MKSTRASAIRSLCPTVEFTTCDNEITYWSDDSVSKPTESQITAEMTKLDNEEPMKLLRLERNILLTACDWTQSRDLTLSNDADWKTYRQALRDLPASASPKLDASGNLDMSSVTFPTKPS